MRITGIAIFAAAVAIGLFFLSLFTFLAVEGRLNHATLSRVPAVGFLFQTAETVRTSAITRAKIAASKPNEATPELLSAIADGRAREAHFRFEESELLKESSSSGGLKALQNQIRQLESRFSELESRIDRIQESTNQNDKEVK